MASFNRDRLITGEARLSMRERLARKPHPCAAGCAARLGSIESAARCVSHDPRDGKPWHQTVTSEVRMARLGRAAWTARYDAARRIDALISAAEEEED